MAILVTTWFGVKINWVKLWLQNQWKWLQETSVHGSQFVEIIVQIVNTSRVADLLIVLFRA